MPEPSAQQQPVLAAAAPPGADPEAALLARARAGDERAFTALVDRHGAAMLRLARVYTTDAALAEDAVQDAWLAALRGLERFEARSSLRTWLFRILLNRLNTRLTREARCIPFSCLFDAAAAAPDPAVEPERFLGADHPRWPEHWKTPPTPWAASPEELLLAAETRDVIARAVAELPPAQREVITLRDIEGWSADEVCNVLGITGTNQRVLLHRARAKVRRALERYFAQG